jgi:predicted transcriptional regulator
MDQADIVDDRPADEIRASVAEGLADIEAGRVVEADEIFDRLEARYQAMAASRL